MLDLTRLALLQAIDEHGSMAGAAAALGYSPSAASAHLRGIEQAWGVRLVERSGTGSTLTAAGHVLAAHVAAARAELEAARAALHGRARPLRLAAFPSAAAHLVDLACAGRPVALLDAEPDRAIDLLARGKVDAAVTYDFAVGNEATVIALDPLRPLVAATDDTAGRPAGLSALAAHRWFGTERCPWYPRLRSQCTVEGFTPSLLGHAVDDLGAMQSIVARGGIAGLWPALAGDPVASCALVHTPEPVLHRRIHLTVRAPLAEAPALRQALTTRLERAVGAAVSAASSPARRGT